VTRLREPGAQDEKRAGGVDMERIRRMVRRLAQFTLSLKAAGRRACKQQVAQDIARENSEGLLSHQKGSRSVKTRAG